VEDRNPSGYAQVLEEWTNNGTATNLSRVYNYGLNLISQRAPGISTNYFIWDGHGSTRVLADAGGNTVNVFAYDAYGTLIASNGAAGTAYLYCGQQLDADLGLYYNRARYLNVGTGRFCTMDSYVGDTEDPLSLHKYLYCQDSPVNGLDPLGQSFIGFDGTGNSSAEIDGGIWSPTNVRKMFIGSTDPHRHYEVGVGTWLGGNDEIGRGFGAGMGRRMDKAMSELIDDRAQGDNLVDIVGFSRGGIEATEFANRVADAFPDERIRFVGLFDPVGSVGFPGSFGGYRHQLSSRVEYSAEAMAENENRVFFPATDVNVTTKQWFRGVHSDIGGGFANHEISDYVLQWMIQQAQGRGVGINLGVIKSTFGWNPNANGPVNSNSGFTSWFTTSGGRTVLGVTGSYTIQFLSADGFSGVGL
jgi:RHS repeat-associated protein